MSAKDNHRPAPGRRGIVAWIARFLKEERAAVSPILVLSLVPIVGALGMGAEASNWWLTQRAVQNAADTAAMSASWNGNGLSGPAGTGSATSYDTTNCSTSPGAFDCEAVGAAAQAGFVNGQGNVVVYPQYLTSGCPTGTGTTCYKVTVTKTLPYYLLGLVLKGGGGSQNVQAIAYSGLENSPTAADCLFSPYAPAGTTAVAVSGTPKANLAGCDVQVNTGNVSCNGNGLQADAIFAGGTITSAGSPCGGVQKPNDANTVTDPYAALDSNIPADTCSNYNGTSIGPTTVFGSTFTSCGPLTLTGNVTVASNTTFYIYNGNLVIPDKDTFASGSSNSLTLVFTGSSTTAGHTVSFGGNKSGLNIAAPTDSSNVWHGVAIYQDPRTNTTDANNTNDISLSGNSIFLFTGVIYSPYGNDTFTGTISPDGLKCFIWVFNTLTIKGTANLFQNSQSQCGSAGVTQVFSDTSVHMLVG